MFWTATPDYGYCLYFPKRAKGFRFIVGKQVRVWPWEQWKHIRLGMFEVTLPTGLFNEVFTTKDNMPFRLRAQFKVVVGGSIEGIETRLEMITVAIPPTRNIRWKVEVDFFRSWVINYCRSSIKKAIIEYTYAELADEDERKRKLSTEIRRELCQNLEKIGLILVESTFIFESPKHIPPDFATEIVLSEDSSSTFSAESPQELRVFLCHSSEDKQAARDLHHRLRADNVEPWLDEEQLLPGQDWDLEIKEAVQSSDVVLVCLSRKCVNKQGYVQKEIAYALDVAALQPERSIFIIPVRLEVCDVPRRLRRWQWVNLYDTGGYDRLIRALQHSARIKVNNPEVADTYTYLS